MTADTIDTGADVTTVVTPAQAQPNHPFFGQTGELGSNWRLQFADADGIPFNMLSFEVIDFGAISYKEIFQNVKTILATPQFSAALERLLGVDQSIVDLPIDRASEATIAILDALYFWEPRAEAVNIQFSGDVIAGHLICTLQLRVSNVIFGTQTPYSRSNAFDVPLSVVQQLPPMNDAVVTEVPGPPGPAGEAGAQGERGSLWFVGPSDPNVTTGLEGALPQDMFLNTTTGAVSQLSSGTKQGPPGPPGPPGPRGAKGQRASTWWFGTTDPTDIPDALPNDLYLNKVSGDVWQLQGTTWRKVGNARNVD